MKKYLSELHTKSPAHKKRFAMLSSGAVTLSIFAVWSAVNFGTYGKLAQSDVQSEKVSEVSPLESLRASVATSFEGILKTLGVLKENLNQFNNEVESVVVPVTDTSSNTQYTNLQSSQIEIYGGE